MPDPRSLMQEFRLLDQKRQGLGLTQAEEARHAELKELVGSSPAPSVRSGFNVNAAAAQLRESLLPAGLRSRPLDAPAPPPAPGFSAPPPPTPPLQAEPPAPAAEPAPDAFFDPATLGQEVRPQAWNPDAPGYDPDAPYDEAAWIAAGYDPNATYDWAALGYDVPQAEAPAGDAAGAPPDALPEPGYEAVAADSLELVDEAGEPAAGSEAAPQFGEYDAMEPGAAVPPPDYGGPEGDSLPGGEPLELGDAPIDLQPEDSLDGSFELASDGSFGEAAPPRQPAPWSDPQESDPAEGWQSAPALDLASSFEAAAGPESFEPPAEEVAAAEPVPEPAWETTPSYDAAPADPGYEAAPADAASEAAPAEPAWEAAPGAPTLEVAPDELVELPEPVAEEAAPLEPAPAPPAMEGWEPAPEPFAEAAPEPFELEAPPPEPALDAAPAYPPSPAFEEAAAAEEIPPEIAAAYAEVEQPAAVPPVVAAPVVAPPVAAPPAPAAWEPPRAPAFDQADPEPVIEPFEEPPPAPVRVAGTHRVVVHTIDGEVKRGLLTDASLDAADLSLDTQGPAGVDVVRTTGVKAIFFMLGQGERAPAPEGRKVRVTFRDGRQVAGFSPDYREGSFGFFMIPADTRTNTGRIWVYQAAVKSVIAG